ncbi:MAG: LemA family protein [Halarcobacter sp.]
MTSSIVILIILIIILLYLYNSLINKKKQVENIFASVDVQLKKRYDLLPNLIANVSRYMEQERELLEKITQLRLQAINPHLSDDEKIQLDSKISSALGTVMLAIKDYPELKLNENILNLQLILNKIEEKISVSKRAYNQAVTDYNNAIEIIPTNFMAKSMNYKRKEVFSLDKKTRED